MDKLDEYIDASKRLEDAKHELETKIYNELGHMVNVQYWDNYDSYAFLAHSYEGFLAVADMLRIGIDILHRETRDSLFPHRLSTGGMCMDENMEVICLLTDKEYQNYKEEHVK